MSKYDEEDLAVVFLEDVPREKISSVVLKVARGLSKKKCDNSGLQHARLVVALLLTSNKGQLLSQSQVEEAENLLMTFILSYLAGHKPDDVNSVSNVIQICERHEPLLHKLVSLCSRKIQLAVEALARVAEDYVVEPVPHVEDTPKTGESEDSNIAGINLLRAIACFKVLSYTDSTVFSAVRGIELELLDLVGSASRELSSQCRDAVNSILIRQGFGWADEGSLRMFWGKVLYLTSNSTDRHHATSGYQLWACLLSKRNNHLKDILVDNSGYLNWLQCGLLAGTTEQRKTCLFILQASLQLLDGFTATTPLSFSINSFTKYSNVYQNCVLQKYLNQIQDALPDLLILAQSNSGIGSSWLLALLGASLEHDTQDAIKNMIGGWILSHGLPIAFGAIDDVPEFLERYFLGWASVGALYASSLTKTFSEPPICYHGERLSQFLVDILSHTMHSATRHRIVKAIMTFIMDGGGSLFATARVFLLQALMTSLISSRLELDQEEIDLVLAIAQQANFQQMARDLMTLQCGEILATVTEVGQDYGKVAAVLKECARIKSTSTDMVGVRDRLQEACNYLKQATADVRESARMVNEPVEHSSRSTVSLERLTTWIRDSRAKCLWHEGLQYSCVYVEACLNPEQGNQLDADELQFAFEAIWDQVEVQDYPKTALMALPRILFHKSSVQLLHKDSSLSMFLSKALQEIHALAENRVYVFPPLAEALYVSFTAVPQAVHLPFVETFMRFANSPPATKIEFQLESAIAPQLELLAANRTYFSYYGPMEAVGHAFIFNTLNSLPDTTQWMTLRHELFDSLLNAWIHQKQPVPMSSKHKTIAQLQTMLLLLEALHAHLSQSELMTYASTFQVILSLEPHPRYRFLIEWILLRLYTLLPLSARSDLLRVLSEADHHGNPKYLASLLKLNLMLARLADSPESFSLELMTHLIPLVASSKIVVRHEAQWTIPLLWSHVENQGWQSVLSNPAFRRLNEHIRSLDAYKSPPPARVLEMFDPSHDHNLVTLCCGPWLSIAPPEPAKVSPKELRGVLAKYHPGGEGSGLLPLTDMSASNEYSISAPHISNKTMGATKLNLATASIPLQIKASTFSLPISVVSESDAGLQTTRRTRNIILIASLIANPVNLGGLSRIAEIFGVSALYIPSLSVLGHKDFTSVSVSSHLWLPIHGLAADGDSNDGGEKSPLRDFLTKKKMEGWKVVGIEQTDSSFVIGKRGYKKDDVQNNDNSAQVDYGKQGNKGEYAFPERVVLLLGSEREGIPPTLLAETDECVEIEQVGQTRSMNVQTAAAVVLYEWVRQWG